MKIFQMTHILLLISGLSKRIFLLPIGNKWLISYSKILGKRTLSLIRRFVILILAVSSVIPQYYEKLLLICGVLSCWNLKLILIVYCTSQCLCAWWTFKCFRYALFSKANLHVFLYLRRRMLKNQNQV